MRVKEQELRPPRAEELSREALIAHLRDLADAAAKPQSLADLGAFVLEYKIRDTFGQAINQLGYMPEAWLGKIKKGKENSQGLFVHAEFWQPPALEGGSALHVYAYEDEEPSFGLLLPFDEFGRLDTSRQISASSTLQGDNVHVFYPQTWIDDKSPDNLFSKEPLTPEQAVQAAEAVAYVTRLSAATLVTLLELEDNAR